MNEKCNCSEGQYKILNRWLCKISGNIEDIRESLNSNRNTIQIIINDDSVDYRVKKVNTRALKYNKDDVDEFIDLLNRRVDEGKK